MFSQQQLVASLFCVRIAGHNLVCLEAEGDCGGQKCGAMYPPSALSSLDQEPQNVFMYGESSSNCSNNECVPPLLTRTSL
jgi:hypothetical protein